MNTLLGLCPAGISGNLMFGALLSYGVPLAFLETELAKLPIRGYHLDVESKEQLGIPGVFCQVIVDGNPLDCQLIDMNASIDGADYSPTLKRRAKLALQHWAQALAYEDNIAVDQVVFPGSDAIKGMVAIVGTMIALEYLDCDVIVFSPFHVGIHDVVAGTATSHLLKDIPCYPTDEEATLVTTVGAVLGQAIGVWRDQMDIDTVQSLIVKGKMGVGLGIDNGDIPNMLAIGDGLEKES